MQVYEIVHQGNGLDVNSQVGSAWFNWSSRQCCVQHRELTVQPVVCVCQDGVTSIAILGSKAAAES